jgi:hypothetical protein
MWLCRQNLTKIMHDQNETRNIANQTTRKNKQTSEIPILLPRRWVLPVRGMRHNWKQNKQQTKKKVTIK